MSESITYTCNCSDYLTSTGIELSVTAGGASAVTSGIAAAAGEYAAATGAAASGEAFLGTVAAGTAISTAGAIVLTAAAAAAVGAFAYWLYTDYLNGSTDSVPVYNSSIFAGFVPCLEVGDSVSLYDNSSNPTTYYITSSSSAVYMAEVYGDDTAGSRPYVYAGVLFSANDFVPVTRNWLGDHVQSRRKIGNYYVMSVGGSSGKHSKHDLFTCIGTFDSRTSDFDTALLQPLFEDFVESESLILNNLCYAPVPEFPDTQQMVLDVGASAGSTLEELAQSIPEQVASNSLNVTYTIVSPDEGSEIDPEPTPTEVPTWVPDWFTRIITTIQALPQAIADKFASILGSIKSSIDALAESIAEAIKNLFEPDPELVTEITTAFTDKFGWLETVHQFGNDLFGMTAESSPPVIYIHLEDAEGRYVYGGTEKALDLSWYQRYKGSVDHILSGFMWIAFLWLVFKRASAIIQGGEMITEYSNDLDEGHRSRRH